MSYDKLDPSRVLNSTSVSLLDCIFLDGHGDAAFAVRPLFSPLSRVWACYLCSLQTRTGGCVTELLRVDPATRCLFPVAMITWPYVRREQPTIFALDLRRHPPGIIPPWVTCNPSYFVWVLMLDPPQIAPNLCYCSHFAMVPYRHHYRQGRI